MASKRQQRFVQEYLKDYNGTRAAIASGYSEKTAYSIANEILRKPEVKALVEQEQHQARTRSEITRDEVISELVRYAFRSRKDAYPDVQVRDAIHAIGKLTEMLGFGDSERFNKRDELREKLKDAFIALAAEEQANNN